MKFSAVNDRGFMRAKFLDRNGVECSLQESSADGASIWLGCNKAEPKEFHPDRGGWVNVPFDEKNGVANTRMHLTQKQVKELLPALRYFVKHGVLPRPEDEE